MEKKHILIVDDDDAIRDTIKLVLESEGYETRSAENGAAALRLIEQLGEPDCILLDLMMPVMNGWQFVDALTDKKICARVPVLVISAFPNPTPTIKCTECMRKPIDLDKLLNKLSFHLTG